MFNLHNEDAMPPVYTETYTPTGTFSEFIFKWMLIYWYPALFQKWFKSVLFWERFGVWACRENIFMFLQLGLSEQIWLKLGIWAKRQALEVNLWLMSWWEFQRDLPSLKYVFTCQRWGWWCWWWDPDHRDRYPLGCKAGFTDTSLIFPWKEACTFQTLKTQDPCPSVLHDSW